MPRTITLDSLLRGCSDTGFDDGIRIDTDLEPLAGAGAPVKPAVYEGGTYQEDRRWASSEDSEPKSVIVIDNVPSQANRLEHALQRNRSSVGIPELVLDLSKLGNLPPHLPRQLSSLQFPHRNADAYLRDAQLDGRNGDDGEDFLKTEIGKSIFGATAQTCGPLMAWFPQALLFGFWQSHLGKKRSNAKHARAWVSEIVGWNPGTNKARVQGLKGDALNLSVDESFTYDPDNSTEWQFGKEKKEAGRKHVRLSKIGHGQVPFMGDEATAAAVSFSRVTQRATVSFAQLRRVTLGTTSGSDADSAARALLVALGLWAHALAFGRGFALRSGAELRPTRTVVTWLGTDRDEQCRALDATGLQTLLEEAKAAAAQAGVPLDGWGRKSLMLVPKPSLRKVIETTWPDFSD